MADIEITTKRVELWQGLKRDVDQAINNITNLIAVKERVLAAKVTAINDTDFTSEDEAKIQAKIDTVIAAIATI